MTLWGFARVGDLSISPGWGIAGPFEGYLPLSRRMVRAAIAAFALTGPWSPPSEGSSPRVCRRTIPSAGNSNAGAACYALSSASHPLDAPYDCIAQIATWQLAAGRGNVAAAGNAPRAAQRIPPIRGICSKTASAQPLGKRLSRRLKLDVRTATVRAREPHPMRRRSSPSGR